MPSLAPSRTIPAPTGAGTSALPKLSPTQQSAFADLRLLAQTVPVTLLRGDRGRGKTTLLRNLHQDLGGRLIRTREMLEQAAISRGDEIVEEAIRVLIREALESHDLVMIDDIFLMETTSSDRGRPLCHLFSAVEVELFELATRLGKRIVMSRSSTPTYAAVQSQAVTVEIPSFKAADYAALITNILGPKGASRLDAEAIIRRGSHLTGYQIEAVCRILRGRALDAPTTEDFLECMEDHVLTSNLELSDVETIEFSSLKGAEEIIKKLDTHVLLPMQRPELARDLGLMPKRGVLLHGLPGTGKTSIGRALAHRMKGRFFLIDGTIATEPASEFYDMIDRIFRAAVRNSPAVIFIDDADVLFKTDHVFGFNRYLLTKLDGLISETVNNVCVMMTAMNVSDLPAPLLRSGRLDVWLEVKVPDAATRREILLHHARALPEQYREFDGGALAEACEGFTPADLRRLIGDATALLAYDMSKGRPTKSFGHYLASAIDALRTLRATVAQATGQEPLAGKGDPVGAAVTRRRES